MVLLQRRTRIPSPPTKPPQASYSSCTSCFLIQFRFMSMEAPLSVFDECRQEVLHEISNAFIQDIKTVLDRKHSARKLLERDFSKSQVRERIVRGKEMYRVL